MRLAICDDEMAVLDELSGLLEEYCAEYGREVKWETFRSPLDRLKTNRRRGRLVARGPFLYFNSLVPNSGFKPIDRKSDI